MARNGSGTFSFVATSVAPAVSNTLIESADFNTTLTEIADALTQSISKDGQTVITGDIDFDGNQLILDVDGDTTIAADTGNRIDFRIGGADKISIDSTGILDANKNEIVSLTSTTSAVNELSITNAATGNDVDIAVTGGDTNIGLSITPKGTGALDLASGAFNGNKGADIASATTTDIGAATGNFVDVTGTTTITGLGTAKAGIKRTVQFDGALILTYNATSLILPGNANITTAAGDVAEFVSLGSGNWVMTNYQSDSISPVLESGAWTPKIQDASFSDAEGQAYSTQEGYYTKIGNRVLISGYVDMSDIGTLSADFYLVGLPFTASATPSTYAGGITATIGGGMSGLVDGDSVVGYVVPATDRARLQVWGSTTGTSSFSNLSTGYFGFVGEYII